MEIKKPSRYDLAIALRTEAGGWSRESLISIGVPWPPTRGWLAELKKADGTNLKQDKWSKLRRKAKENKKAKNAKKNSPFSSTSIPKEHMAMRAMPETPHIGKRKHGYIDSKLFYSSVEWKKLRYLALVNNGGACQCCGARASDGITLNVDHIISRWDNPSKQLDINNLQILCQDCNFGKGAWDDTDWREHWKSIGKE